MRDVSISAEIVATAEAEGEGVEGEGALFLGGGVEEVFELLAGGFAEFLGAGLEALLVDGGGDVVDFVAVVVAEGAGAVDEGAVSDDGGCGGAKEADA